MDKKEAQIAGKIAKAQKSKKKTEPVSATTVFAIIMGIVAVISVLALFAPETNDSKKEELNEIIQLAKKSDQLLEVGDREGAIAVMDEAIATSLNSGRDYPEFHFNKGVTLMELQQYPEAIESLYKSLALANKGDSKRADTHINLAIAHKQAGNVTASIHHWKQAAKMRPKKGEFAFSAGDALKDAGDVVEAAKFFEMAHKANPNNPKFLFAVGWVQRILGQPDEETQALVDKALTLGTADEHYELAMWLKEEQPGAALAHFKKFIELEPRSPSVRTAIYNMARLYGDLDAHNQTDSLINLAVERGIWNDARQRPGVFLGLLTPSAPFPWENITSLVSQPVNLLESKYEAIKAEILAAVEAENDQPTPYFSTKTDAEHLADPEGSWRHIVFARNGVAFERTFKHFPVTGKIFRQFLDGPSFQMPKCSLQISILAPGAHIEPHCGPTNHRLRLQLGLATPEGSSITVGGETRSWPEGKVLVIDDSFEHEVWNNGTTPRIVLTADVWHPLLAEEDITKIRTGLGWSKRSSPEAHLH